MSKLLDTRFKDQENREWTVRFDGNTMRDINAELGINICDAMADTKSFTESLNIDNMMAMVWIACREQADATNVDAKQFLSGLYGDTLSDLQRACWSAIINFSQPSQSLGAAEKIVTQTFAALRKRREKNRQEIEALTPEDVELLMEPDEEPETIQQILAKKRAQKAARESASTNSSSSSPDTSESTPAA